MPAEADTALIARLFEQTRATSRPPAPGWSEYARELARAGAEWLEALLAPVARGLGARVQWLEYAAIGLVVVTLALLLFMLGRALVLSLRRRREPAGAPAAPREPAAAPGASKGPGYWRSEVDARLAQGDVKGALAALWWWLAAALVTRNVDATWTSRELLEHAQRRDLLPLARALDRQAYGPIPPGHDEVRRLAARMEGALR